MKGFKTYRHKGNPKEGEIHDKFVKHCGHNHDTFDRIGLSLDGRGNPVGYISNREKQIMITTIQWLGTHVGQGFLRDCGYEPKK